MNGKPDIDRIIALLKSVLGNSAGAIPLHEPLFAGKEWVYLKDCLDTGWVSSVGKYIDKFEKYLTQFTGIKHATAVVNGTSALQICLKLSGVEQGDEVLLPALTFIAAANAVCYCGAIPHFIDSDIQSLGLDPKKLGDYLEEKTFFRDGLSYNRQSKRPVKAVIAMHTFGHPVDLDPLKDVCEKFKLVLIEDAAEALGSYYKERHAGSYGKLSALSFNGNKIVTTGGGGAILTNDASLARQAKHLTTTAKLPHPWAYVHDQVGYNYRLPNINAALGCAQIEQLDKFLQNKRALAEKFQQAFANEVGVSFFTEPAYARSNYWLNVLLLDEEHAALRDTLLLKTHEVGILTRPPWTLMHKLPMFQSCPRTDLAVAERLEQRIINIPSSASLGVNNNCET